MARLRKMYEERIQAELQKKLGYENKLAVPKFEKVVLNMGLGSMASVGSATVVNKAPAKGKGANNQKSISLVDYAISQLELIAGQKAIKTKARKAIAGFKIRKGMVVGAKVTLRRARMYEFLDRLINIALPRVRDFRGISGQCLDGRGNCTLGLKEYIIFPETEYQDLKQVVGLSVCIHTTAKNDEDAKELLSSFNFPFARSK